MKITLEIFIIIIIITQHQKESFNNSENLKHYYWQLVWIKSVHQMEDSILDILDLKG